MEGRLSTKVPFLLLFLFIASFTAAEDEPSIKVVARVGTDPTSIVFAPLGKNVELICDLGEVSDSYKKRISTRWSFTPKNGVGIPDLGSYCKFMASSDDDSDEKVTNQTTNISECEVEFKRDDENNHLLFILELEKIVNNNFGEYMCHAENAGKINHTYVLQEIVTLTRRPHEKRTERSLTITEGNVLQLYCNATGLNTWHEISWWKDGHMNITEDLNGGLGLFENFTKTDDLMYFGDAVMDHRGNYTCRVDLKNDTIEAELPGLRQHFPVKFSTYIRVQEAGRWQLPLYILLGEAGLIGLFTIIINIREKRYGEGEADGDYEDSDDEDETQVSKNGGMNNNSSSS